MESQAGLQGISRGPHRDLQWAPVWLQRGCKGIQKAIRPQEGGELAWVRLGPGAGPTLLRRGSCVDITRHQAGGGGNKLEDHGEPNGANDNDNETTNVDDNEHAHNDSDVQCGCAYSDVVLRCDSSGPSKKL